MNFGLEKGEYLALLTHSGSRGTGADIAKHYSSLAKQLHPELPKNLSNLAWLDLVEIIARFDPKLVKMALPGRHRRKGKKRP